MKRSSSERIADLEQRAAKLRADSDRRLSVASNPFCSLCWDAEKAVRAVAAYSGSDGDAQYGAVADAFANAREAHWKKVRDARG